MNLKLEYIYLIYFKYQIQMCGCDGYTYQGNFKSTLFACEK